MTRRRLRVPDLPPESIGAVRDLDAADVIFKRIWSSGAPATRQEFAPPGIAAKLRWIRDKVLMREETI